MDFSKIVSRLTIYKGDEKLASRLPSVAGLLAHWNAWGDVVGDVFCVPAYSMDHHGRHRVEELESHEVQARFALYDASLVHWPFCSEDGEVDP